MSDAINPDHYKRLPAEAIEIIESAINSAPSNRDAYLHGQVLKYVLRCWNKNGIEDLRKAKWYLDRLINRLDESEQQKAADLQSLKKHPFGKLKTAPLNSDTVPQGYRKLKDSSIEPRQLGDLRWSVAEKRYIEISVDEIGYANRDNWAACRKIEPAIKQPLNTEPPDGWRFLEVDEVIRKGDVPFENGQIRSLGLLMIGQTCQTHWKPIIRRNRFEVGEKVVRLSEHCKVYEVQVRAGGEFVMLAGFDSPVNVNELAPYIEETT